MVDGNKRRFRRRGKDLVPSPCVADTKEAKDHGKILFRRTHPFRAASSDIAQVTARCNVDIQYTTRLPVLQSFDTIENDAMGSDDKPTLRWQQSLRIKLQSKLQKSILFSVGCAFRAAHCADYYITKYSSKSLQTFSPLMLQLQRSMRKLEEDEEQERNTSPPKNVCESSAGCSRDSAQALAPLPDTHDAKKKQGPHARARRVLYRMLYAANRSFWLSCTELYVIVSTGGAGWSTHHEKVVFLARGMYMAKALKRALENKPENKHEEHKFLLGMLQTSDASEGQSASAMPETTFTETTSLQDDYLHRGRQLKDMTLYVYAMHITRVPKTKLLAQTSELFFFSPHYPLFSRFAQKLEFYARVPRLVGPAVPTLAQDPETNALMKALLFTPYECSNCWCCASPTNLSLLLAKGQQGAHDDSQSWTFLKAWQTRRADIELLANAMQTQDAAQKNAHDCRLCGAAKVAATRSTAAGLQSRITEIHCQRVGGLVFADAYLGNHCQVFVRHTFHNFVSRPS